MRFDVLLLGGGGRGENQEVEENNRKQELRKSVDLFSSAKNVFYTSGDWQSENTVIFL